MNYIKLFQDNTAYEADKPNFLHPHVSFIKDERRVIYEKTAPHDYSKDYLTFEALESGTFRFSGNSVNYSLDSGATWASLASNTESPTVNVGEKIMFKATLIPATSNGVGMFYSTGAFNVMGNPYSLLDETDFRTITDLTGYNYALYKLFANMGGLVSAENLSLPATTLADVCYGYMFDGCTSLVAAPELPATTLAQGCYSCMFYGCTGLTTAPVLPATALASHCYEYMFDGCTSLTTAPVLPVTTLELACYMGMFKGCTSLVEAPALPATTLVTSCYNNMFNGCASLTTAPELPATTLVALCYGSMFQNCTSLNYIKMLATDISANRCLQAWVQNVAPTGTFIKNASMTTLPTGGDGIPSGWTVINA